MLRPRPGATFRHDLGRNAAQIWRAKGILSPDAFPHATLLALHERCEHGLRRIETGHGDGKEYGRCVLIGWRLGCTTFSLSIRNDSATLRIC